jgi:siroheme synthase-like protein
MGYYPVMMDLTNAECLVIGGGEVALRKAESLVEAGARVTVIAPEVDPRLETLRNTRVEKRLYSSGDAVDRALVFAATDDRRVNECISDEAKANGIPVNVVDDPELCSFIVPSCVRRGDLVIAASTSGRSPSLSKRIRKELELTYGPEYGEFVALLGELRGVIKEKHSLPGEREQAFERIMYGGVLELLRAGERDKAREKALECI